MQGGTGHSKDTVSHNDATGDSDDAKTPIAKEVDGGANGSHGSIRGMIRAQTEEVMIASIPDYETSDPSLGITPEFADSYTAHVIGNIEGIPGPWGCLAFDPTNADRLFIGGNANDEDGALFSVEVERNSIGHIIGHVLGSVHEVRPLEFNDGACVFDPSGVLWASQWPVNNILQLRLDDPERHWIDLTALGVPRYISTEPGDLNESHAALGFVPDGYPGSGILKLVSWPSGKWFGATYRANADGFYDVTDVLDTGLALEGGPEGFTYVPLNSPLFPKPSILVSNYLEGTVAAYELNETGDPIINSRRLMLTSLRHAEGATIDPKTGDFIFGTFNRSKPDVLVSIHGFNPPRITAITPDIPAWVVFIDINGDGVPNADEPQTVADAHGRYEFLDLGPGQYEVRVVIPNGWQSVAPGGDVQAAEIQAGEETADVDFILSN